MKNFLFVTVMAILFVSCKDDNQPTPNNNDKDPQAGSRWEYYGIHYEITSPIDNGGFGVPIDTVGAIMVLTARDTTLNGKKWLAIYRSLLEYNVEEYSELAYYIQKRSDGWWAKNGDTPNMDVEGLWLPFEYTQGVIFNGVNVYDHWSFYPGLQDIQVKEAKYTYGAENPNKYVIGYAKPSFMDGSEEITDSYLTKYSENGIVQYAADTEKTLETISGDEYYYTTLYKLKSFTR
jgi:hypothetical protein